MPMYLKRWLAQGRKPNGDTASTIFDLQHDYRHVIVYPATRDCYAVTIGVAGVRLLASTAKSGDACAVPAMHAVHGMRLLGLHPYNSPGEPPWPNRPAGTPPYPGPMELYLVLPRDEIRIVYRHDRRHRLTDILAEIADTLT